MTNYVLKEMAAGLWEIRLNRKRVGFVRLLTTGVNEGRYVARINQGEVVIRDTVKGAFTEVVAVQNRIFLCGKNDPEAARRALDERNRRAVEEAAREREAIEELVTGIEEVFPNSQVRQLMTPPRVRRRKVAL